MSVDISVCLNYLHKKLYGFEPYLTANRMQQLRTTRLGSDQNLLHSGFYQKTGFGLLEQENSKYLYVPDTLQGSFWEI